MRRGGRNSGLDHHSWKSVAVEHGGVPRFARTARWERFILGKRAVAGGATENGGAA
jgi:hypothetical protein